MKINILDIEQLISVNKLKEVVSPKLFANKMIFDQDGILSNEIFGISKGDRRSTFAYINLKQKFIHPHIYANILKRVFRGVMYIVSGQKRYSVQNGSLIVDQENGWTGLANLYKHWDEINWDHLNSANSSAISVLKNVPKDQIFIDKFIICPPAYRDVMLAGTVDSSDHINELNNIYIKIIRSVALLQEGGLFARTQYATQMKIQTTLIELFNYFKIQISGKTGLIKRNLIGKSVDFGVRSVISAGTYRNQNLKDNMVDIRHCALPISQCCSAFYPFIQSWLTNFFTREIINNPNLVSYYDEESKKEVQAVLVDADIQFSERSIKKMINDYIFNPDNRFKIIKVKAITTGNNKTVKPLMVTLIFKGKKFLSSDIFENIKRPLTITDILYLACVDTCEKRHLMVTRYPIGTDKGLFFNKIRVQSTRSHINLMFNDKEYPYYPNIDLNLPHHKIGVEFIDTLVYSNSLLDAMGADYDGDQITGRGLWSDEANDEADRLMSNKMSALTISGKNSRVVAKEVYNSYYELTKIPNNPVGKEISDLVQNQYLNSNFENITLSQLADIFADHTILGDSNTSGKVKHIKSKYNTWDKFTIPKDYFYPDQPEIQTTIGRFVVNKFVLQGSGIIDKVKFINTEINKKGLDGIDNKIGECYLNDIITREQFDAYIDRRDTLGYWANGMLAHTVSQKMLAPLKEVEKKKAELIKKYQKELDEGNLIVMDNISKELVDYARELLKDDPGMDLYLSGDLSFENNYKNNAILKGAVINKIENKYDFIGTSFMDGIDVKDLPSHANSVLSSQYPGSIATKDSGYMGKKLLALLQMMQVDEPGTDCGTKHLIPVLITAANKNDIKYTYIDAGDGQLLLLDDSNIDSFVGKTVMMRTPMSCLTDKICSKCAGQLFYKLGAEYAGLFSTQITHSILNLALKAKHDTQVHLFKLDPDDIIDDI